MEILVFIVILSAIWWLDTHDVETKTENKALLSVDSKRKSFDSSKSVSLAEIKRRYASGYYDRVG